MGLGAPENQDPEGPPATTRLSSGRKTRPCKAPTAENVEKVRRRDPYSHVSFRRDVLDREVIAPRHEGDAVERPAPSS